MDAKRKGKKIWCKKCQQKTRHIYETDKTEKHVYWCCEICGNFKTWCNYT